MTQKYHQLYYGNNNDINKIQTTTHLSHVPEVEHVQGYAENGVHDGGGLAQHCLGHYVAVAIHGEYGQGEHERGGERPRLLGGPAVVALFDDERQVDLEVRERVRHLPRPVVPVQHVVRVCGVPHVHRTVVPEQFDRVVLRVARLALDLYEAERAHHRVADHQATDAHLCAHERHQLPAALLQPLLGVVGAGRVVRRRRRTSATLVAHRHHCTPPTDRPYTDYRHYASSTPTPPL